MNARNPQFSPELRSIINWWQLAGVDCDFSPDATDWLARSNAANTAAATLERKSSQAVPQKTSASRDPEKTIEKVDLLGANPPSDLLEFQRWWLEAPGLDEIGPRGRVPPRGSARPDLMVLVIDPEQNDRELLLSGEKGKLLQRMLAAMGMSEDRVYIASALPRHTPMADTQALAARGMAAVTARHIDLVAPKRLLAFGTNIPPLLGHKPTKDVSNLREINQNSQSIPLLVSEGLDSLMAMPRLKARFWRRWIEWSVEE